MPETSDVEAQLAEQRAAQLAAMNARDQERERRKQEAREKRLAIEGYAKKAAGRAIRRYGKQVIGKAAARYGIGAVLAATAPAWGTILLIFGIGAFLIIVLTATCNSTTGWLANWGAKIVTFGQVDICGPLEIASRSGGAGGGASYPLDIVVTSAYRPGAKTIRGGPSAHGRAEAIDIALRNPIVPLRGSDPRITQLVSIAQAAGFTPAKGNTLNEYAEPECDPNASSCGGHVHVEFNTYTKDGKTYTYCDDTEVKVTPTDLIAIPSDIKVEGASHPQVRPCMLGPITAIFNAAK
ncbi:MAG: hypothetical protein HYV13_03410 [Candidatus Doudnabacteria bacterium]|nr:hypothetical protein [Candidatus Doudnabacteria bacterium]